MSKKPILAYDCATTGATVALLLNGQTYERCLSQTEQAAQLVPSIDALLREHGIAYTDLNCIVSTIGPGSFTGVRIGLAALHGLVLVTNTPIKLLSTLATMAWQVAARADAPSQFHVILRAGKGEVYAQRFQLKQQVPTSDGEIFLAPETQSTWDAPCFGTLTDMDDPHYIAAPSAATLCMIADQLPTTTLADAVPLYIRAPDALPPAPLAWLNTN